METRKEWFETWFDSPYYHVLYDHRNEEEAKKFISNLEDRLHLNRKDRVLDLACGAGRHTAILSKQAGEAIGVDLSFNSIGQANNTWQNDNLEFYVHDMRLPFRINYFDYIFNLFTSFGYFQRNQENLRVLQSVWKGLKPGGKFLIDYMNSALAISELVEREEVVKQEIPFYIRRTVEDGRIIKNIKFDAEGKVYSFSESVQAFLQEDFRAMAAKTRFDLVEEFGDYDLTPFDSTTSPRYILLMQKPLI